VVDNLRLSVEQGLSVQGTAKSSDLVIQFEQNLNKSGIFGGVKIDRAETTGAGGVEFEASAQVVSPFIEAAPLEDFAGKTLAVRLYGEGALNTQPPAGGSGEGGLAGRREPAIHAVSEERAGASARTASAANAEPEEERPKAESGTRAEKDGKEAPAELTDAQIAAMDFKTAMKEMSERGKYINATKDLDKATRDRLEAEKTRLKDRMAEAKKAGAGAAGSTGASGGTGGGK
jgi:hypothetical protein